MATIVSPEFGDEIRRTLDEFLEGLKAILAIRSDAEFLRRLEELLTILRSTEQLQGREMSEEFEGLFDGPAENLCGRPAEQKRSGKTHGMSRNIDNQFDRIEALLEIAAGGTRSYTPKAIAKLEGVKPEAVREWIKVGKLRAVPDPNRMAGPHPRKMILAEDYERFKRGGH
jgi:hypothetical protein